MSWCSTRATSRRRWRPTSTCWWSSVSAARASPPSRGGDGDRGTPGSPGTGGLGARGGERGDRGAGRPSQPPPSARQCTGVPGAVSIPSTPGRAASRPRGGSSWTGTPPSPAVKAFAPQVPWGRPSCPGWTLREGDAGGEPGLPLCLTSTWQDPSAKTGWTRGAGAAASTKGPARVQTPHGSSERPRR